MSSSPFRCVQGPGPRTENRTWDWLGSNSLEVMDRHPYSPDLALTDFHCFRPPLKKHFAGKRFAAHFDVKQAVTFRQ